MVVRASCCLPWLAFDFLSPLHCVRQSCAGFFPLCLFVRATDQFAGHRVQLVAHSGGCHSPGGAKKCHRLRSGEQSGQSARRRAIADEWARKRNARAFEPPPPPSMEAAAAGHCCSTISVRFGAYATGAGSCARHCACAHEAAPTSAVAFRSRFESCSRMSPSEHREETKSI